MRRNCAKRRRGDQSKHNDRGSQMARQAKTVDFPIGITSALKGEGPRFCSPSTSREPLSGGRQRTSISWWGSRSMGDSQ